MFVFVFALELFIFIIRGMMIDLDSDKGITEIFGSFVSIDNFCVIVVFSGIRSA